MWSPEPPTSSWRDARTKSPTTTSTDTFQNLPKPNLLCLRCLRSQRCEPRGRAWVGWRRREEKDGWQSVGEGLPSKDSRNRQPQLALVDLTGDNLGKKRRRVWKSHHSKLDSHWPLGPLKGPSSPGSAFLDPLRILWL